MNPRPFLRRLARHETLLIVLAWCILVVVGLALILPYANVKG